MLWEGDVEGLSRPQTLTCLSLPRAICSILGIWLEHKDFLQPLEFLCVRLLLACIQVSFPGSSLEHRAQLLL